MSVSRVDQGHRRSFREAVALHQLAPREGFKFFLDFGRQGSSPADAEPNGSHIRAGDPGVTTDGVVQSRYRAENGGLVLFDLLHDIGQLKAWEQQHRRLRDDGQMHPGGHSVAVEKGENTQQYFLSVLHVPEPLPGLTGIHNQIAMG